MSADLRAVVLILAFACFVLAIVVTPRVKHLQPLTWVAVGLALWLLTLLWDAIEAAGWW